MTLEQSNLDRLIIEIENRLELISKYEYADAKAAMGHLSTSFTVAFENMEYLNGFDRGVPCGKAHNNARPESECSECMVIKAGI